MSIPTPEQSLSFYKYFSVLLKIYIFVASYSRNGHLTDIFREAYFAYIPINVKLGHFRIECLIRSICENGLPLGVYSCL